MFENVLQYIFPDSKTHILSAGFAVNIHYIFFAPRIFWRCIWLGCPCLHYRNIRNKYQVCLKRLCLKWSCTLLKIKIFYILESDLKKKTWIPMNLKSPFIRRKDSKRIPKSWQTDGKRRAKGSERSLTSFCYPFVFHFRQFSNPFYVICPSLCYRFNSHLPSFWYHFAISFQTFYYPLLSVHTVFTSGWHNY